MIDQLVGIVVIALIGGFIFVLFAYSPDDEDEIEDPSDLPREEIISALEEQTGFEEGELKAYRYSIRPKRGERGE